MTSHSHPKPEDFLWYTRHGLALALQDWPSARVEAFEEHVATCDSCAAFLAAEAEAELLLIEVANTPETAPQQSMRRWLYATAAALAVVIVVGVRGSFAGNTPTHAPTAEAISLDAGVIVADGDTPSPAH